MKRSYKPMGPNDKRHKPDAQTIIIRNVPGDTMLQLTNLASEQTQSREAYIRALLITHAANPQGNIEQTCIEQTFTEQRFQRPRLIIEWDR